MKQATKYNYEKRIKELEAQLYKTKSDLCAYRELAFDIHADLTKFVGEGKILNQGYMLSLFKRLFR